MSVKKHTVKSTTEGCLGQPSEKQKGKIKMSNFNRKEEELKLESIIKEFEAFKESENCISDENKAKFIEEKRKLISHVLSDYIKDSDETDYVKSFELVYLYNDLGSSFSDIGDNKYAERFYLEGKRMLKIMKDLGGNYYAEAVFYNNLAFFYMKTERKTEGELMYDMSLSAYEKLIEDKYTEDENFEAFLSGYLKTCLDCISSVESQKEYAASLKLCERGIKFRTEAYRSRNALYSMAFIYGFAANNCVMLEKIDDAIEYYKESAEAFSFFTDKIALETRAKSFDTIGMIYLGSEDFYEARENFSKAIMIYELLSEEYEDDASEYEKALEALNQNYDLCMDYIREDDYFPFDYDEE